MIETIVKGSEIESVIKDAELVTEFKMEILTPEQYELAAGGLADYKKRIKMLDEERMSQTRHLDAAKKKIIDFFSGPREIYFKAAQTIEKAMLNYQYAEEKKRQENEAKLRVLAEKEAERQRKALEVKAVKANAMGDTEKADQLRDQAASVDIPAPIVESNVPKVAGTSIRENWLFRITDQNLIPREYLIPDTVMLGKIARASHDKIKIAGIEFYAAHSVATRR